MNKSSERAQIDILRERLKRSSSNNCLEPSTKDILMLPSIGVRSPSEFIPKKLHSGFSRDISYMKDPKLQIRAPSKESQLLQAISPHLQLEEEPGFVPDLASSSISKPLEDRLDEALSVFCETSEDLQGEGLSVYKNYTKLILAHLESIYMEKQKYPRMDFLSLQKINPSGRRELDLLAKWLSCMLGEYVKDTSKPIYQKIQAYTLILRLCLKELIRQVSVHCNERGQLLEKVIDALNDSYTMNDSGQDAKIEELYVRIQNLKVEHEKEITKKVNRVHAQNLKVQTKLNRKIKELEEVTRDKEELFRDIQTFKKRVDFLQSEMDTYSRFNPSNLFVFKQSSEDSIVLKKHACTFTDDADFLDKIQYDKVWYPPTEQPVLLVGEFQGATFKKTAAYVPKEGKIVAFDFPVHLIEVAKTRHVATATVDKIEEVQSKEFVQISPNMVREIEVEDIIHYDNSVPITHVIGLYSLILSKEGFTKATKGVQAPAVLPDMNCKTETVAHVLGKKRVRKTKRKKAENEIDDDGSSLKPSMKLNYRRNQLSRTNSMRSVSSNKSRIKENVLASTQVAILADEMNRFSHTLNDMMICEHDVRNDEECRTQSERIKKLFDVCFPKHESSFLNAIRDSRRNSLLLDIKEELHQGSKDKKKINFYEDKPSIVIEEKGISETESQIIDEEFKTMINSTSERILPVLTKSFNQSFSRENEISHSYKEHRKNSENDVNEYSENEGDYSENPFEKSSENILEINTKQNLDKSEHKNVKTSHYSSKANVQTHKRKHNTRIEHKKHEISISNEIAKDDRQREEEIHETKQKIMSTNENEQIPGRKTMKETKEYRLDLPGFKSEKAAVKKRRTTKEVRNKHNTDVKNKVHELENQEEADKNYQSPEKLEIMKKRKDKAPMKLNNIELEELNENEHFFEEHKEPDKLEKPIKHSPRKLENKRMTIKVKRKHENKKKTIEGEIPRSSRSSLSAMVDSVAKFDKEVQVNFGVPMVSYQSQAISGARGLHRTKSLTPKMQNQFNKMVGNLTSSFVPSNVSVRLPVNIQPFSFGRKPGSSEASHPGLVFIKNFLGHLSKHTTISSSMSLKQLSKTISRVYLDKYTMAKENSKAKAAPAGVILYELMQKQYGLKTVAEQKLRHVVLGCLSFGDSHIRVQNFKMFLGLSGPFALEDWNFYMAMLEQCLFSLPGNIYLNKDDSPNQYLLFDRLLTFVDSFFKDKVNDYSQLLAEINAITLEEDSKMMGRKLSFVKICADETFIILIKYLKELKEKTLKYIEHNFEWVDEDSLEWNDFYDLIMTIGDVSESLITGFFNIFKDKSEFGEFISVDAVVWFIIENSLIRFDSL